MTDSISERISKLDREGVELLADNLEEALSATEQAQAERVALSENDGRTEARAPAIESRQVRRAELEFELDLLTRGNVSSSFKRIREINKELKELS